MYNILKDVLTPWRRFKAGMSVDAKALEGRDIDALIANGDIADAAAPPPAVEAEVKTATKVSKKTA